MRIPIIPTEIPMFPIMPIKFPIILIMIRISIGIIGMIKNIRTSGIIRIIVRNIRISKILDNTQVRGVAI